MRGCFTKYGQRRRRMKVRTRALRSLARRGQTNEVLRIGLQFIAEDSSMASANVVYWVTSKETEPEKIALDWDCPCLASARQSPCFPQFRAAIECMDLDNGATEKCHAEIEAMDVCFRNE
jgi:hypothetical protein